MLAADLPERLNVASIVLDDPAQRHPDRVAILGEPCAFTYGQLAKLANRIGNALLTGECEPGDRVLIALPDSAEFIAAFFGAVKIGAIAVPVNSMARATDYAHFLRDCRPHIAIVHSSALPEFLKSLKELQPPEIVVVGDESVGVREPRCLHWRNWADAAPDHLTAAETSPFDAAFLLYTSGTGGPPNGALHQHKDMLIASSAYAHRVLGLREDDIVFSVSKLFFAYGLGNAMYFPLSVGAKMVLNPVRANIARVSELLRRYRPTVFFAVPTFYASLLAEADENIVSDFSSVRLAVSAGETLPSELFERFRRRFGLEILDGIGSTEMLHIFLSSRPGAARPGSCGIPTPGYEARIVDEEGRDVAEGEIGNLLVRGASAFAGYWNNPELTARVKLGEWVATRDKFSRDASGYYYYAGRADDMLKISGMWVSPVEIENALLGHPLVVEAAVVARVGADGLTQTVAFVVLKHGAAASPELDQNIREHVRSCLAAYKCPREVRFCSELPKTATGKIQRFLLREAGLA